MAAMAVPALSEITPAEVWDQLIAENESVGIELTEGSREEAGDTLTITDAVFSNESATSSMEMTMPKVVLNQTGDGGVRWFLEGDVTGSITEVTPDDTEIVIPFTLSMPVNETVTTGSFEDLTHEYTAETVTVTMEFPVDEGQSAPVPLTITMEGLSGTQRSIEQGAAGGREVDFDGAITRLGFALDANIEEGEGRGAGTAAGEYVMDGLEMTGRFVLAQGVDNLEEQLEEALRGGMEVVLDASYTGGTGSFTFNGTDSDGAPTNGEGSMTAGPGKLSFAMSDEGLTYSADVESSTNTFSNSRMPFPVQYALNAGSFELAIPVLPSDEPAPFTFKSAISGLTVNDEVWALFDPNAQLPRDAADLNIDVAGDLLMTESLLNPPMNPSAPEPSGEAQGGDEATGDDMAGDDMADDGEAMPGMEAMPEPPMPVKVTINDISLKAVGAEAKVQGELTAPEGGTMAEAPVGQITGEFTGIESLMGTLGAMGLIPQEQMMGARMMLSMFARPVEGEPGKLTTELEFRDDGSIFANGQQVK
ncbi:hypothetical protein CUV01_07155 [Paracoccus tegillarcae]|uniref:DUF2125 domain-containing protein n=2 Tax=Paracoccus tegillarcae TaxID=1529068 RepID=A0A2K9ER08_9RHOB|nr:hypothetical protein CUV01_07155 [Paracoccus tegillarcae]